MLQIWTALLQDVAMRTNGLSGCIWLVMSVLFSGSNASAQDYPTKPIRFVVTNAPGGGTDMMARLIAQKLNEAWGQAVVVDNRPGGNGAVGSLVAAKSSPDGYTLLIVTSDTHAIVPNLYRKPPYDPVKDFASIALIATGPQVMVAHPSLQANSIKELVAVALAKPGTLNYASPGSGSLGHMMGELFQAITVTKIVHVPYKGSGSALADLLGGYVQLMFSGPGAARPHVRARRLKALAVTSRERAAGLEEVPTFAESGYPAVEAAQWYGVLTTAGTPQAVVDKINRETVRILQLPEVKERFLSSGYNAATSTPQEFARIIKDDLAKWQTVVKASGMPSID